MKCTAMFVIVYWLFACFGNAQGKSECVEVGIVADDPTFSRYIDWFKTGMAHQGYVEDDDIEYIFYGFVDDDGNMLQAEKVVSDNPDAIFALGNYSALWAKKAIAGTGIPAVFSMVSSNPISDGIVESLRQPEGNITGIRIPDSIPKALEWLVEAVPGAQKIFVPYDPEDEISVLALKGLADAASRLGVEIVIHKVSSVEAAVAAVEALPEDFDAVFRIPSQVFELRAMALSDAAIRRKIPEGSATEMVDQALVIFSPKDEKTGRQAARLVNKILKGANPADFPIESAELFLTINLKIAEKIGVHVPDSILVNANTIVR